MSYPMSTAKRAVPVAVTHSDSAMKANTTRPSPASVGHPICLSGRCMTPYDFPRLAHDTQALRVVVTAIRSRRTTFLSWWLVEDRLVLRRDAATRLRGGAKRVEYRFKPPLPCNTRF